MLNFDIQCKKVKNTFYTVIDECPLAAILMLGNLFCSLVQSPDHDLLKSTLLDLKSTLSDKQVQLLFSTATTLSVDRLKLMSQTNNMSIELLQHRMMQDKDFFKHLPITALTTLGQNMLFYREVFVAIIRRHLYEHKMSDPFENPDFSYDLLAQAAPEQNVSYLSRFIKMCPIVPLDDIVLLGASNVEIASLILMDVQDTQMFFEISSRFAYLHAALRQEIASTWQTHVETLPLTKKDEQFNQEKLPILKEQFPEFEAIGYENRVKRNNQVNPFVNKYKPLMKLLTTVNLASIYTSVGIPYALSQVGLCLTIPPLTISLPLCYSMGYSMYQLFKNPEEIKIDPHEEVTPGSKKRVTA